MRKRIEILLCSGLIIFGALAGKSAAQESKLVEKAGEFLKKVTSDSTSGLAILVARDGKVLLETAAGMADIETKVAATKDTKFRIGSISKQFTAMAVLRLAEQGKLSLQDPLSKYYPDFPNAQSITLEHLLTHTSGLHSYTDKPDFLGRVTEEAKPEAIIKYFEKEKPDFNPGAQFKYCNSGYFLLGEIVAKVSGKTFAEYLATEFFKPLEMNNTGIYVNAEVPENMAVGYSLDGDKYEPALNWDMSWAGGAGALYSTVGDLHRWNESLYSGKVVGQDSLKAATTPFKLPADVSASNYGYGLSIAKYRRVPIISHSGGLNGWSADLAYFPDENCTIVVLTNAAPSAPELSPQLIARKLADTALEDVIKAMPAPEVDATIDPKSFAEYVGKYDYQGAVMEVTVVDNRIYAQLTGQAALEIFPMGKDEFFWKIVEAEVVFQRDEKGEIKAARHTQNGATFNAPKIVDDVALTEAQLEACVGRYRYGIAVMTCTREGNQLYAQLTGQPRLPIFPVNETTFKWKVVEAQVEFIKDEQGRVTMARHTQNGTTFDAPRIKGRMKR